MHARREWWQLFESDHRNAEKETNKMKCRAGERKKKDVASTAFKRKGTVIHR
jgi:hypothetical protein